MKKRILLTILAILMFMIFVSCNSCTSSSAQSAKESTADPVYEMTQDTVKITRDSTYVSFTFTPITVQDTQQQKEIVVKKEVKQEMIIDTVVKISPKESYDRLEKTQMDIKAQQKILDSMLVVKKK